MDFIQGCKRTGITVDLSVSRKAGITDSKHQGQ